MSLKRLLVKNDISGEVCGKNGCMTCRLTGDDSLGKCTVRSVVYKNVSELCKLEGNNSYYWGETSRTR